MLPHDSFGGRLKYRQDTVKSDSSLRYEFIIISYLKVL